jgi:oligopeptide transport system permease protein
VQAAKALGATSFSQMFKHILPNVLHLASVQFNLTFIMAIKYEVILSYLGLGVEPGTPSWGLMISDAQLELSRGVWWNLLAATGFMFILILAVNLMTESIEKSRSPQS